MFNDEITNIVNTIENNYNNIEILKIVKYLIGVVINDIEYMNNIDNEELDLGNGHRIVNDDYQELSIIINTINNILEVNK
jgi:hypothetical protein